ncbi:NTP transferase domain-containing protein, partial [Tepidiforma sp.]|uniref:NTP transferase domain-containing protein n=1 Tax=Tepidiforma sp. TaxID=2682230 RepID=UPI00345B7F17
MIVVRAPGQETPALDSPVPLIRVHDAVPGCGPLAGLAAGFAAAESDFVFACSCDAPLVAPALISRLAGIAR